MATLKFILASRGSPLALQQSNWVKAEIERLVPGSSAEILTIRTTGDRVIHLPLPQIGGKGLFTKEVEDALLDGRASLAVHSLKDLPTELPPGLVLAAVPRREDPRDALVSRNGERLQDLPRQARVGTGSVRRAAQLKRLRPDLQIEPLRGNLDTRLRRLRPESPKLPLDAIVLAAAGLRRMGFDSQISEYFDEEVLCPAVGQGALGIEARADDPSTLKALAALEDPWARFTVTAERSLLRHLGGGCQVPIAAFVKRQNEQVCLTAIVISPDGSALLKASELSPPGAFNAKRRIEIGAAEELGRRTAESLLQKGAGEILKQVLQDGMVLPFPQAP